MQIRFTYAWASALVLGVAMLSFILAGCGSASTTGSGMMGNRSGNYATQGGPAMMGPGMMGGASGYHFSTLTCTAPTDLPGSRINVGLADMGMTHMMGSTAALGAHMMLRSSPTSVVAGQVSFVAANLGWRTHELLILPLGAGESAGHEVPGPDNKINEKGSLGEASSSCGAGPGEGITSGSAGWVTVRLTPGRYELVCNLANHYTDGMHQELLVTAA